jgi:hypothetical protein
VTTGGPSPDRGLLSHTPSRRHHVGRGRVGTDPRGGLGDPPLHPRLPRPGCPLLQCAGPGHSWARAGEVGLVHVDGLGRDAGGRRHLHPPSPTTRRWGLTIAPVATGNGRMYSPLRGVRPSRPSTRPASRTPACSSTARGTIRGRRPPTESNPHNPERPNVASHHGPGRIRTTHPTRS